MTPSRRLAPIKHCLANCTRARLTLAVELAVRPVVPCGRVQPVLAGDALEARLVPALGRTRSVSNIVGRRFGTGGTRPGRTDSVSRQEVTRIL